MGNGVRPYFPFLFAGYVKLIVDFALCWSEWKVRDFSKMHSYFLRAVFIRGYCFNVQREKRASEAKIIV